MKAFLKTIILILVFLVLGLFVYLFVGKSKPAESVEWGVSFSKRAADGFGIDWKEVFSAILNDLGTKRIRIVAYWNEIEKEEGKYDFSDLDWQIEQIANKRVETIVVVGRRLPRWPECFEPDWIKSYPEEQKQEKILALISEIINRYKNEKSIRIWQVENEPFLRTFGECPPLDRDFFDKEIALVRSIDPIRPIMITESGEFSTWIGGAKRADIIGTSLYRKIHGKLGYVQYPIPPVFYQRKANLIKAFFGINDIIAIEVQAEPWGDKPTQDLTKEEQDITMSFERFNDVVEYTRQAGFDKAYLWGAEWWYWLREKKGINDFVEVIKELKKE